MAKAKEVTRIILKGLLISGGVAVATTSPRFLYNIFPKLFKITTSKIMKKRKEQKYNRSFYYLKSKDMISFEDRGGQLYISLTEKGKKQAGKYKIDDLKFRKTDKWDGKWRVLIFDIKEKHKIKREALRGKIKQLGMYKLQNSVWVYPYCFKAEMEILRNFFQINTNEMKIIVALEIENDQLLKKNFNLDKI